MESSELRKRVAEAINAAQAKKAQDLIVLEMDRESPSFTDYFVIASGSNPRQIQAISDEIEQRLERVGLHPVSVEGYNLAEWVLLDYVDFVVHVFSEKARKYYDLERLWKSAKRLEAADLEKPVRKPATRKVTKAKPAARRKSATPKRAAARKARKSSRS